MEDRLDVSRVDQNFKLSLNIELNAISYSSNQSCRKRSFPFPSLEQRFLQPGIQPMCMVLACTGNDKGTDTTPPPSTCAHDMSCLLSGASTSIQHITSLDLCVKRRRPVDPRTPFPGSIFLSIIVPSGTGLDHLVPRRAFARLAAAVPRLQRLTTSVQYGDVDLAAFGSLCPDLRELVMTCDALSLQGIDMALPNLTHLHVSSTHVTFRTRNHVKTYVERACLLLRGCSNLTSVTISFQGHRPEPDGQLKCSRKVWEQLPASLVEFHSNASFALLHKAASFMSRVRVLSLGQMPEEFMRLPDLLRCAPQLQSLTIWHPTEPVGQELELMWHADVSKVEISGLKARLQGGFQLSCEAVSFTGPGKLIADMMTWMSPPKDTHTCRVCFVDLADDTTLACLSRVPRLCPAVDYLKLGYEFISGGAALVSESTLVHVMQCKHLVRLDVYIKVAFTHAGLVCLCTSLPALSQMFIQPCEGVSYEGVMAELASTGREIHLAEIVEGEDLPDAYEV